MIHSKMTRFLVIALLLISSYDWRASCDAVGAQIELQQQPQQQFQPQEQVGQLAVDTSAQVNNANIGVAAGATGATAATTATGAAGAAGAVEAVGGDELSKWQQSGLYLASFDPAVTAIPVMQREFVNRMVENDLQLFREILREAIERRNKFAPSVGLIWKYAGKLLSRLISNRREEMKLPERLEPRPEFFKMLADLADTVIKRSSEVKKERGYSKNNIDTDELYRRTDSVFRYIQSTIEVAPVGAYLKWDELILFKNDPTNPYHDTPLVVEAADLTAQFRSMGYESCVFVANRIVNLLRMFSRGSIPQSDKEV